MSTPDVVGREVDRTSAASDSPQESGGGHENASDSRRKDAPCGGRSVQRMLSRAGVRTHTWDVSRMSWPRSVLSRTWLRSPWFVIGLAMVSGVLGVIVAMAVGAPIGPDHSCPSGSSASACHYPPDARAWLLSWGAGGVAIGLALGLLMAITLGTDGPHRRPQKHLLVQGRDPH
jgi:hypothetical protein